MLLSFKEKIMLLDFIEHEIKISIQESQFERLDYLEKIKEILETS